MAAAAALSACRRSSQVVLAYFADAAPHVMGIDHGQAFAVLFDLVRQEVHQACAHLLTQGTPGWKRCMRGLHSAIDILGVTIMNVSYVPARGRVDRSERARFIVSFKNGHRSAGRRTYRN